MCTVCSAQIIFGVKGGAGFADVISTRQQEDLSRGRLSYQGGFLARAQLQERLGMQAELLFLKKGQEGMYAPAIGIPLLIWYRPLELLELEAGIYPNYSMAVTDGDTNDLSNLWNQPFDIAMLVGTRYFISNRLGVNTRLGYGLLNVRDATSFSHENNSVTKVEKAGLHHVNLMLSLEYYF